MLVDGLFTALSDNRYELLRDELNAFSERKQDAFCERQMELVRRQAQQFLQTATPELSYASFSEYWISGDRIRYETKYFERRGRLLVFALMVWWEPEEQSWANALSEIIWSICAEPFWAMPAHYYSANGMEEYATHLDLFACETGFALAETLVIARQTLPEMVVKQAELQVQRRIFEPFLDSSRQFQFETMSNNWSAVCAGAIGGAALHMLPCGVQLNRLIQRCLKAMQVYLGSFGEDGVCVEGVGYWAYGFGFYTCFSDLLEKRSEGRIKLLEDPKAKSISLSQQFYYFSGGSPINFSDGLETTACRIGLSRYLYRKTGAAVPPVAEDTLDDHCYRFAIALRDFLWGEETAASVPAEKICQWLPDAQWFLSKSDAIAIAAKAGNNGENHGHNDCGSFILYKNGKAVVCDLGAGIYNAASFGPERYNLLVNRSKSHNVPQPDGYEQHVGAEFTSGDVSVELDGSVHRFSADLSRCYCLPYNLSMIRHLRRVKKQSA